MLVFSRRRGDSRLENFSTSFDLEDDTGVLDCTDHLMQVNGVLLVICGGRGEVSWANVSRIESSYSARKVRTKGRVSALSKAPTKSAAFSRGGGGGLLGP